ncbi:MAG TPA: YciI family protein [Cyclobacteriaceae bacterium]|nr:YciI family protein [Cyclobacteriaceae bacterium]
MKTIVVAVFLLSIIPLFAQENLMFVFLNTNPDRVRISEQEAAELQKAHLQNIGRLAAEGKLLIAGPMMGGGGIFVLNTSSLDEANEWLQTDAAIRANRFNLEIFHFKPYVGGVCAAKEDAEMVQYHFIRFSPNLTKFNIQQESDLMNTHTDFVKSLNKTGNVLVAGDLGERAGSILVMRGDLQKEVIEADPGIRGTILDVEFKQLYIAKGSFCEN